MRTIVLILAVFLLAMFVMGCGFGLIYTHTVQPVFYGAGALTRESQDFRQTSVVLNEKTGDIKNIWVPFIAGGLIDVAWGSDAYGDIAKKNGMNELYFADLETLSVLSIWYQYTVHLYGK